MSTNLTAQAIGLTARERTQVEPRRREQVSGAQKALVGGAVALVFLGAAAFGRLQSTITARDAEILTLTQARFDLDTRVSDLEYRLRVLWEDVRIGEEKARASSSSS